ncbi:hypothetical protein [Bacillus sp. MB2021]|uniref:hypothetical protein n=1 Tax=Bacillus sp. MB2021 TaxID=1408303 RepID=UPI0012DE8ED7|nr:hypothetical protein [Bacillus sp. MB2021]
MAIVPFGLFGFVVMGKEVAVYFVLLVFLVFVLIRLLALLDELLEVFVVKHVVCPSLL